MSDLQIIRTNELAELLSVSTVTIWKWEKKGLLPPKVKINRVAGWRKADIEKWLEKHTEESEKIPA